MQHRLRRSLMMPHVTWSACLSVCVCAKTAEPINSRLWGRRMWIKILPIHMPPRGMTKWRCGLLPSYSGHIIIIIIIITITSCLLEEMSACVSVYILTLCGRLCWSLFGDVVANNERQEYKKDACYGRQNPRHGNRHNVNSS